MSNPVASATQSVDPTIPPTDRWVAYVGDQPVTVPGIGAWNPDGPPRLLPGNLAAGLLHHAQFRPAEAPAAVEPADDKAAAPTPRRRGADDKQPIL